MAPALRIRLLGDFRLEYKGKPVTALNASRLQSLLAYLALKSSAPHSRQRLAFVFWPDSTEAQARTNLRKSLYLLRRALPDADRFLRADTHTVAWRSDIPLIVDVAEFENALSQAEQASDSETAQNALEKAASLYEGELLPGLYDEWVLPERERLQQVFIEALERLAQLLEDRRDYRAAIHCAQRLLRHAPLHEDTYRRLMRLHALNSDRSSALRVYQTCVTVVKRELGVGPSHATRQAYERLLSTEAPPARPGLAIADVSRLIGREEEWRQLQAAWRACLPGKPHLVLITGETGIGKTRLAEELLRWAANQGIPTASASCCASTDRLAYGPVTTLLRSNALKTTFNKLDPVWLSELTRLLPELLPAHPDLDPPGSLTESWQRQRLYEALSRPFFARRQLVLLIDDLQWCDPETLSWSPYLLQNHGAALQPTDRPTRLLIVGTVSVEGMPVDPQLTALLRNLRRNGQLTEIELGPLNRDHVSALAASIEAQGLDETLAAELYLETEGNPLFVVETVRAKLSLLDREPQAARRPWPTPPTVQDVIAARLDQLSPAGLDLARLAATIGRAFTFAVLAEASSEDEEALVDGLDELWHRRIVREQDGDSYDFSHYKIREVAYASLSSAQRRLLHRRVAEAMERIYTDNVDDVCGLIAAHHEAAGQLDRATSCYQLAATNAQGINANQQAVDHLRRAIALLPQGVGPHSQAAQLREQLGDIWALMGQHNDARRMYASASACVPATEKLRRADLCRKMANTWRSQHHYDEAWTNYDAAGELLGPKPASSDPSWWQTWLDILFDRVQVLYFQQQLSEMEDLCEQMRGTVEAYGSPSQLADFFSSLAMLNNRKNRFIATAETIEHARTALRWAEKTGDRQPISNKTFSLAFSLLWSGELEEAAKKMTTALAQAEKTGDIPLQDRCLAYLTVIYRLKGDPNQVRTYIDQGLTVAMTEANPLYLGAAKANLAWLDYRDGKTDESLRNGYAALDHWHAIVWPFEWLARWPLIAGAVSMVKIADAVDHSQALLEPAQQPPPEKLTATLKRAIQGWDDGRSESARLHLECALQLAQRLSYL